MGCLGYFETFGANLGQSRDRRSNRILLKDATVEDTWFRHLDELPNGICLLSMILEEVAIRIVEVGI